ncbi:MAG: hypothetical protein H6510_01880 [Acidobacteria bacterium]|nr:hypothetical protein [Acidobacteriota bacterium]MCB9396541.1 hypothetical protein [Acidobacteriota bacterium]
MYIPQSSASTYTVSYSSSQSNSVSTPDSAKAEQDPKTLGEDQKQRNLARSEDAVELSEEGQQKQAESQKEQEKIDALQRRDREVRQHERAHQAVAGSFALGGPSYEFQTGPDGKRYAVGGEVEVDVSEVPGDPAATIRKMEIIRRSALAPANPSAPDYRIANKASANIRKAEADLAQELAASANTNTPNNASSANNTSASATSDPSAGPTQPARYNLYGLPEDPRRDTAFSQIA